MINQDSNYWDDMFMQGCQNLFEIARKNVSGSEEWLRCDLERSFAIEQSGIADEWRDMIIESVDRQWEMVIREMYRMF